MFRQNMILHRSGPVVLVVRDQTSFFFGGIVDTTLLGHIMAHKTMHGLSNNGMGFTTIIDKKTMLK
jgi:hypothetical protein